MPSFFALPTDSMAPPDRQSPVSRGESTDKRAALLDAALDLFAREGHQSVTTAAIAERAGVAKGTLFVYFDSRQDLVNELYLEVVDRYIATVTDAVDPSSSKEVRFRAYWFALARWYLEERSAANVMLQLEASSALDETTEARKEEMEAQMVRSHFPGADLAGRGSPPRRIVHALTAGPILVLAHLREKGAAEITDELLEQTFARVKRAVMPEDEW